MKSYDQKQQSKHTIYLEANNLYGYAITKFLPRSELKWIGKIKMDTEKV